MTSQLTSMSRRLTIASSSLCSSIMIMLFHIFLYVRCAFKLASVKQIPPSCTTGYRFTGQGAQAPAPQMGYSTLLRLPKARSDMWDNTYICTNKELAHRWWTPPA